MILVIKSNDILHAFIQRKNPKNCFQFDKTGSMADWESVIIWGTY